MNRAGSNNRFIHSFKPFSMPGHPRDYDPKDENNQPKPAPAPADKKPAQQEPEKTVPEKKQTDDDEKFHRH
jgi:hypothetical protein